MSHVFQTEPCFGAKDDKRAFVIKFESSSRFGVEVSNRSAARKSNPRIGKRHELKKRVSGVILSIHKSLVYFL